ncbi:hypothetical protein AB0383_26275 [Amycolatopsis sp. NPDC051373]|uniref:hypothetical protein n=1 Tax=Amycolatopsis sp. NPDC051373 TaxID=3155801 RepID=UPI00344CFE7B
MDGLDWRSRLIAPARALDGGPAQVVVGRVAHAGTFFAAAQIDTGAPVLLRPQAANELIANIRQVVDRNAQGKP